MIMPAIDPSKVVVVIGQYPLRTAAYAGPEGRPGVASRSANSTALLTNLAFFIPPEDMESAHEGRRRRYVGKE